MNKTVLASLIGAIATITAAIIGVNFGKNSEQKLIQNEINEVMGDMVNIIGDDNKVTINDIKDLVEDYQNLKIQNESLSAQNTKYFEDLTNVNNEVEELQSEINNIPNIQIKNIGLSINGEEIPINSTNSSVIVDNRIYYSDEFIKNIINPDSNITIQDEIMYIGKIIKEKSYLSNEWILNKNEIYLEDNVTDSYGNLRTNALIFKNGSSSIIYNLNKKYSLLKCNLSIRDNANMDKTGIITIKADDTVVYTSPTLTKTTNPFSEEDIPINNCTLLTIEYNTTSNYNQCILDNITVYN